MSTISLVTGERKSNENAGKKLKQRLQELEMRGGLSCKSPPQGYAESGEMHEMNGARVLEQEEAHVDAQYFQWQELDDNSKGMTPSKAPNECYYGGSKDALFTGGSARVPERLSDSAGSDGGDDGDGGVGEDDDKFDEAQPQALQDCRSNPPEHRPNVLTLFPRLGRVDNPKAELRPRADDVRQATQQENLYC